jgi:hypothetical protein
LERGEERGEETGEGELEGERRRQSLTSTAAATGAPGEARRLCELQARRRLRELQERNPSASSRGQERVEPCSRGGEGDLDGELEGERRRESSANPSTRGFIRPPVSAARADARRGECGERAQPGSRATRKMAVCAGPGRDRCLALTGPGSNLRPGNQTTRARVILHPMGHAHAYTGNQTDGYIISG